MIEFCELFHFYDKKQDCVEITIRVQSNQLRLIPRMYGILCFQ